MTLIRFPIGRWSEGSNLLIERLAQYLRHLHIEAQPGNDCRLFLNLAIETDPDTSGAQDNTVLRTEIDGHNDGIDDELVATSQVYKEIIGFGHERFSQVPRYWGLQEKARPTAESTA